MNVRWFRIRPDSHLSWHIASGLVSRANHPKALCGRWGASPETVDERPGNERTCERCYQLSEVK